MSVCADCSRTLSPSVWRSDLIHSSCVSFLRFILLKVSPFFFFFFFNAFLMRQCLLHPSNILATSLLLSIHFPRFNLSFRPFSLRQSFLPYCSYYVSLPFHALSLLSVHPFFSFCQIFLPSIFSLSVLPSMLPSIFPSSNLPSIHFPFVKSSIHSSYVNHSFPLFPLRQSAFCQSFIPFVLPTSVLPSIHSPVILHSPFLPRYFTHRISNSTFPPSIISTSSIPSTK